LRVRGGGRVEINLLAWEGGGTQFGRLYRKSGTLDTLGDRFHFRKIIFSKSASHFDLLNPEQFSTIIKKTVCEVPLRESLTAKQENF
jgi:hypothetical protein